MNVQNLLNQFVGQPQNRTTVSQGSSAIGGFAGGAAAGGVMALLIGNKKARKFAGKAATYGGAAVLGGLAFTALKNWQQNQQAGSPQASTTIPTPTPRLSASFELTLVKTMISAANADGHIDEEEQSRIFSALDSLNVDDNLRSTITDLIRYPESPESIARHVSSIEQRSEVYLMACFTIDVDTPEEQTFLTRLAKALELPADLTQQLEMQASEVASQAA